MIQTKILCQGSSLVIRARSSGMTQKSNTSILVKQTTSPKPEGCTSAQAVQQGGCCATVRLSMRSSTLNILRCVSEDIWWKQPELLGLILCHHYFVCPLMALWKQEFFSHPNTTAASHLPYSAYLAAFPFFPCSIKKLKLRGHYFNIAEKTQYAQQIPTCISVSKN